MLFELLLLIGTLTVLYYFHLKRKWTLWEKKGVPFIPGTFPFGSTAVFNWDVVLGRKNFNQMALEQASSLGFPKVFGVYDFGTPLLVVNDPEIAKQVMVKDFDHFVNRQGDALAFLLEGKTEVDQAWGKQITSLRGEEWKHSRMTFTPIFTGGKLKGMIHFIHQVTDELIKSLDACVAKDQPVNLKDKFGNMSMDAISSCAFGLNANSFNDKNSTNKRHARRIFRNSGKDFFKLFCAMMPGGVKLMELMNIPVMKGPETEFFLKIIRDTIAHRLLTKTRRNDLVDLMIDAMNENRTKGAREDQDSDELSIGATALVILVAGYDTTAQTMALTSYYLAKNPDCQEKLYQEIMDAVSEMDDEHPDYNLVQGLPYLDMVVHETLRIMPALGVITRGCSKDYPFPGIDYVIPKGTELHIYVGGIHMNPDIYPDPEKFDPERFSKEAKAERHPYAFLGFGQGPRSCIGMRFALLEAKLALFATLRKYKLKTCPETVEAFTLDPSAILSNPKEDLLIKLEAR
uniref:Cytochrome P450 CYP3026A2 n=1 Tax=Tigriopus kingsejongensis TaxID=1133412 RepID=A0A2H4FY83_9MAXI|nr:cytochrome P450 CYP3026A2 [Tigriopus kingsejongensis]